VHGEETDNATKIELEGARLMREEETKGGTNVKLGELNPCRKEIEQELRYEGRAKRGDEREKSLERGRATQSRESDPRVKRRWNGGEG
jgi:hypothetical protein